MKIHYQHHLTQEEAYKRINKLIPKLQKQYKEDITNPKTEWNDDHTRMEFSVGIKGVDLAGEITLNGKDINLEADVPLIARLFTDQIESLIRGKLDELFA
jgi:hypothetical protein